MTLRGRCSEGQGRNAIAPFAQWRAGPQALRVRSLSRGSSVSRPIRAKHCIEIGNGRLGTSATLILSGMPYPIAYLSQSNEQTSMGLAITSGGLA
jgi:hypothetical protein